MTVITSGAADHRCGLTVSSLFVAEGTPSRIHFLLGEDTDLADTLSRHGRCVVHVLEVGQRHLSDLFAGFRPRPGGVFADVAFEDSPYGPMLEEVGTKAFCMFEERRSWGGAHLLVDVVIDEVVIDDLDAPLQWFRGSYRGLEGG